MTQLYAGTTSYMPSSYQGDAQKKQTSANAPKNSHNINISQILVDFRNTIASIGATPEVEQKVNEYISMVETEAAKETPRKETIVTYLKTASKLLDEYISQTLKKPSSVVQDWIDAFLLQEVDYKADAQKAVISASAQLESEMDPQMKKQLEAQAQAQFNDNSTSAVANYNNYQNQIHSKKNVQHSHTQSVPKQDDITPPQSQEEPVKPKKSMKFATPDGKIVQGDQIIGEKKADGKTIIYTPEEAAQKTLETQDAPIENPNPPQQVNLPRIQQKTEPEESAISKNTLIQSFYEKAKKLLENGDSQQALDSYKKTLNYAKKTNDKQAQAYIIQGIGESYDDLNNLARAAKCYNKVTRMTKDTSLKATGHNSLGEVYDEAGNFDLAMDHYFESLALNGEVDNTSSQAQTLNNIGKMKTSQYMSKEAIDFYKLALEMAKQKEPDIATMGSVLNNTADAFKMLNKPQSALKYYQKSLVCAGKVDDKKTSAEAYEKAGDLMRDMNKTQKAQSLYKKAMQEALNSKNTEQVKVIREKMAALTS